MTRIKRGGLPFELVLGGRLVNFGGEEFGLMAGLRSFLTLVFLPREEKKPPVGLLGGANVAGCDRGERTEDGISMVDARFGVLAGATIPTKYV